MKPQRLWKVNKSKLPVRAKSGWQFFYFYIKFQDWKTIAWCLLLASVFWLFNSLNHQHTTTINFSVTPKPPKSDSLLVNISTELTKLGVNVTTDGWKLLPLYLRFSSEDIIIPVDVIGQKKVVTSQQISQLVSEIYPDFKINFVSKDTFSFEYHYYLEKQISVDLPPQSIWLSENVMIVREPKIYPKMINVKGPLPFLNQIDDTLFVQIPLKNVEQDFSGSMPLKLPEIPFLSYSPKEVEVYFEVVKVKRSEFSFSIAWKNVPKELQVATEPSFGVIKVAYNETDIFDSDEYKKIVLDFNDINQQNLTIKPKINYSPVALQFRVMPSFFKVRITEKQPANK